MMEYLTKADIVFINQNTVVRHGGNFVPPYNFLHEENLDYLIEAVQAKLFGTDVYPEIHHKAGLYMFNIISNHIFQDGNKRTGLAAALSFLEINGYHLKDELEYIHTNSDSTGHSANELFIDFVLTIAQGKLSLEQCQAWFLLNMERF